MSKRNTVIDLLKGISIILIVFGHAFNTDTYYSQNVDFARRFVYLFHLSTFFFTAGYTFKNYDLKVFLKNKFYSLYIPFLFFEIISLILYPLWKYFNVIDTIPFESFILKITRILLFIPSGIFDGAMWFVPALFVALFTYYLIYNLKINKIIKMILIILISLFGYLLTLYVGMRIINRGLLMLPFVFLGNLSKKHNLLEFIKPFHFFILFPLLLVINNNTYFEIEISKSLLANGWFYLISIIGIAFCVSLAKIIEKSPPVVKIINMLALNSFNIMALHFIVFKSVDKVYSSVIKNNDLIREYPIGYTKLRPFYFILGIFVSILLGKILETILIKIKKKIQIYI